MHWEYIYNCVRPHYSLGNKTPLQFLKAHGIIAELEFKLNPMAADPKKLMEIKKEIAEQKKDV